MKARQAIQLGQVQETLFIPLYGRAVETKKPHGLLRDSKAVEMVESIDYDFRKLDGKRSLFGTVLRTAMLDEWIKAFLASSPTSTVIEIGAGLNTRFERLDNGRLRWFDLDLPDATALRRRFFEDTERRTMLSSSVLEPGWVPVVKQSPGPYFFVAEGVFIYLQEQEVRSVLERIVREFPGSSIAFDTGSRWMIANQHKHDVMKKMEARFTWACDDPKELERWESGLRLIESRTLADAQAPLKPKVPFAFRYVAPLLFRKAIEGYKLNLFQVVRAA